MARTIHIICITLEKSKYLRASKCTCTCVVIVTVCSKPLLLFSTFHAVSEILHCTMYMQVYKGPGTSCHVPITAFSSPYEARVRCSTTCMVNELEEQLWSGHSSSVQCVCTKKNNTEQLAEVDGVPRGGGGGEGQGSMADGKDKTVKSKEPLSVQAWGVIVFVVLSIITLILAFVLGQYAM